MKILVLLIITGVSFYIMGLKTSLKTVDPVEEPVIYRDYNGYDLLEAVNDYRISEGYPPLELYFPLCNNIAKRWQNYIDNNSHEGLNEFTNEFMPNEGIVAEVLAFGATAEEVVQNWAGSPSHDLFIKNNTKTCAYAADGSAILLLTK